MSDNQGSAFLRVLPTVEERRIWHAIAAQYYEKKANYLDAAIHWYEADEIIVCVELLIAYYRLIVDAGRIAELYAFREKLTKAALQEEQIWARFKIAMGRAALIAEDFETAIKEFTEALKVNHPLLKGQAFYYRAKAYSKTRLPDALSSYWRGIELIQPYVNDSTEYRNLYIDLQIGLAWLYVQENENLAEAQKSLLAAQAILQADDFTRQCDLENAWARFCSKQKDSEGELKHRFRAWMAAHETEDKELIIKTAINLAHSYLRANRQEFPLEYIQEAVAIARQIGHRHWEAKCHEVIGSWHYFEKAYGEAIHHYKIADKVYHEIGNENWLGWNYFNLAEAYAELRENDSNGQARLYFKKATQYALEVGAGDLMAKLDGLTGHFPWIKSELTEDEIKILGFVQNHGVISNRQCRSLLNIAQSTAEHLLQSLAKKGTLIWNGKKGPAYGYLLNDSSKE
ncbi:MAG: hypothetical protein U0175_14055 [Caldilineaceae bacterium]